MKGLERLDVIRELSRKSPNWVHKDIFRLLRKTDIWVAAYKNIQENQRIKETLNQMVLIRLQKIQKSVLDESYQFEPLKQKWISKASKATRKISTPNDKLVQEVIRIILNAIYEPNFDNRNFGFRNGIGVHEALEYVENNFKCVDWVIKSDIKNSYPMIEDKKLCEILAQRIQDQRFMNLIRKSLKSIVDKNHNISLWYSKSGVPKESIISPILASIYFNELDKWINQKIKEFSTKNSLNPYSEYEKLEYQIQKIVNLARKINKSSKKYHNYIQTLKHLIQQRQNTPNLAKQNVQIKYTRYAYDWIIGVKGSNKLSETIKNEVQEFLCSYLRINLDPTQIKIINLRAGKFYFLGYDIFLPRNTKLVTYQKKNGSQIIRRSAPNLRFHLPIKEVKKNLSQTGYITYIGNKIRPTSKSNYTTLPDEVIVNHFRNIWLALFHFYSGCTNRSHLQYIHYLLHMSCAMSLAHRHRSSSRKIFKKHGKKLVILDKKTDTFKVIAFFPYRNSWKVSDKKWQCAKVFKDPFLIGTTHVSKTNLNKSYCICQETDKIEIQHGKHVFK